MMKLNMKDDIKGAKLFLNKEESKIYMKFCDTGYVFKILFDYKRRESKEFKSFEEFLEYHNQLKNYLDKRFTNEEKGNLKKGLKYI